MQTTITDDAALRAIIPNIQTAARGETPWTVRLASFFESAEAEAEALLAPLAMLREADAEGLKRLIAWRGWSLAIPSVDLAATPNGFAVVSNSNLAPASRERVGAALASARLEADRAALRLLAALRAVDKWWKTRQSSRFWTLFDPCEWPAADGRRFAAYIKDSRAIRIAEEWLARNILGPEAFTLLRREAWRQWAQESGGDSDDTRILRAARAAVRILMNPGEGDFKKGSMNLLAVLDSAEGEVAEAWRGSNIYRAFKTEPYENTKESGGFFF